MVDNETRYPVSMNKLLVAATLLVGILIYIAYSNTFTAPPALDDFHTFVEEPLVRIQHWSLDSISALSQTKFKWNRWIPMITLSFDLWLGKGELFFFHLTNLIIHFLCFLSVVFLVYQVCRSVQNENQSNDSPLQSATISIWVAGLWALHPLQTNAVTYIVQRMASLAALFTILSVAFYLAGRLATVRQKRWNATAFIFLALSLVSTIMAFVSKENSAIIPVLLVCTEAWFFQPDLFGRILSIVRRRRLLSGVGICIILVVFTYLFSTKVLPGYEFRNFTLIQRLLTESRVVLWYISLLLWPHPGRLSLEHDILISTSLFHPPTTIVSIAILGIVGWWTMSKRKRYPLITYGTLWFILNMMIESTVIPLELVFEHRMYLSSVGLLLALVTTIHAILSSRFSAVGAKDLFKLIWSTYAIIVCILTLTTFQRNRAWQDLVILASDGVLKAPESPRTHANLAIALSRAKRYQEAIHQANVAISLGKKDFEAYGVAANTIIVSYAQLGEYQTAIDEGEMLLKEKPVGLNAGALPAAYLNLASTNEKLGRLEGAFVNSREALSIVQRAPGISTDLKDIAFRSLERLLKKAAEDNIDIDGYGVPDPGEGPIKTRIAQTLLGLGDRSAARVFLKSAVAEGDKEGGRLLSEILEEDELNRIQENRKDFTQKFVSRPFSTFNTCMALAFLIQKHRLSAPFTRMGETLVDYALEHHPESADAHLLKGWYHYEKNDADEAVKEAHHSLQLDPKNARA
jgi:tetratricopeptide (TPR) repeat protein